MFLDQVALLLFVITCLSCHVSAQSIDQAECPNIESVANVDPERLLGLWFQVAHYGDRGESCVALNVIPGRYDIYLARFAVAQGASEGQMVKGIARYIYELPQSHFDIWLHQTCATCPSIYVSNMRLLATDYVSYSLFFSCTEIDPASSNGACTSGSACSMRQMWLFSRSGDPVSLSKYDKLTRQVLGLKKPTLRPIDQFGCPRMPDFMYLHGLPA